MELDIKLVIAVRDGDMNRVQELLSIFNDIVKNNILSMAAGYGHIQMVEMLLDEDADPNKGFALEEAAENDHIQIIELLLAAGSDIRNLTEDQQEQFKHLVPIYISMQEYLMLEPFIIDILELKDRFIVDVIPNKKYVILKN